MSFADDLRKTADEVNYKNSSEYKAAQKKDFIKRHQKFLKSQLRFAMIDETKGRCSSAAFGGYCSIEKYEFDGLVFYDRCDKTCMFKFDKTDKEPYYVFGSRGNSRYLHALRNLYVDGISGDWELTDENVDVVLSRYYLFSEEAAIEIFFYLDTFYFIIK